MLVPKHSMHVVSWNGKVLSILCPNLSPHSVKNREGVGQTKTAGSVSLFQLCNQLLILSFDVLEIGGDLLKVERVVLGRQSIRFQFELADFSSRFALGFHTLQK